MTPSDKTVEAVARAMRNCVANIEEGNTYKEMAKAAVAAIRTQESMSELSPRNATATKSGDNSATADGESIGCEESDHATMTRSDEPPSILRQLRSRNITQFSATGIGTSINGKGFIAV